MAILNAVAETHSIFDVLWCNLSSQLFYLVELYVIIIYT